MVRTFDANTAPGALMPRPVVTGGTVSDQIRRAAERRSKCVDCVAVRLTKVVREFRKLHGSHRLLLRSTTELVSERTERMGMSTKKLRAKRVSPSGDRDRSDIKIAVDTRSRHRSHHDARVL